MNLYQEEILEHYKHPHNKKRLEGATVSVESINPLCGDKVIVEMVVKDGVIEDVGFQGDGCAISQASMSMLTDELIGMHTKDLVKIDEKYILDLLGVDVGPGRLKCALLPIKAITDACKKIADMQ